MHAGGVLGIDASSLDGGGGVTHLRELLAAGDSERHGFGRIVVWARAATLCQLPDRPWLELRHVRALDRGLARRIAWQALELPRAIAAEACDVVFIPGGGGVRGARCAVVTMSQNMLPFEPAEAARYGHGWMRLRLALLRQRHAAGFASADGAVFLTRYAQERIASQLARRPRRVAIIPHGVDDRFRAPRTAPSATPESVRLLYTSIVDVYKHQWNVVTAVARLRARGRDVRLDLVGPAYAPALRRLRAALAQHDPSGAWARYHGPVPFDRVHEWYRQADAFILASTCENMPNVLLEAMAAGLPIASSRAGPMPEILQDAGTYFDAEDPSSIAQAVDALLRDDELRARLASRAAEISRQYGWRRTADETFAFLAGFLRA